MHYYLCCKCNLVIVFLWWAPGWQPKSVKEGKAFAPFLGKFFVQVQLGARCPSTLEGVVQERFSREKNAPPPWLKHRQVTDLDVTDVGVVGAQIPFCATGALWGRVTRFS